MKNKAFIVTVIIVLFFALAVSAVSAQSSTRRQRTVTNYELRVNSNIGGAQVEVRGGEGEKGTRKNGNIPYSVTLEPGTYTVTVQSPGYQDGSATVNLNGNQTITINLQPLKATIVPSTHHPDFIVIVDGKQQGSGVVKVDPGTHTIEMRIGALSASGTYMFEAGQTYRIQPTLGIDFDF